MKNDYMHKEINERVSESGNFNDISQRINFHVIKRTKSKIHIKFFRFINVFLILFIVLFSIFLFSKNKFFSSSENISVESQVSSKISEEQIAPILSLPSKIVFRNITYRSSSMSELNIKNYELDTILAYLINENDYEKFNSVNPNIEYCLDESNFIQYTNGTPKFPIYSIVNYSFEKVIAILVNEIGTLLYVSDQFS